MAVGYSALRTGPVSTLVEHFNGTSWSIVQAPNPGTFDELRGVSSAPNGHIYAVGFTCPDNFTCNTLVLRNDQG